MKKVFVKNLLRRVKKNVVFMKVVIVFVVFDGEKFIFVDRYNIRLFVFVKNVRFFKIFIIKYGYI